MTDCPHSPVTGSSPGRPALPLPSRGMLLLTSYTICSTYNQQQSVRRRAHLRSASAVAIDAESLLLILCGSSKNGGGRTGTRRVAACKFPADAGGGGLRRHRNKEAAGCKSAAKAAGKRSCN